MVKSSELSKTRKLKKSQNVTSFFEESIANTRTSPKMKLNVIVDIHNDDRKSESEDIPTSEALDKKETKQSEQSNCFKSSSQKSKILQKENQLHSIDYKTKNSKDHIKRSHENLTMLSLDLIEEFKEPKRNARMIKSLSEEKPHRRKQWNTVNTMSENSKKPPRRRWSKDTSVIQLPEASDVSTMMSKPVPAPRSSIRQIMDSSFFNNPTFVSENEEVLTIETDHNQKSTKIELRRMSDRLNIENIEDIGQVKISDTSTSHCSLKKSRKEAVENNNRSPKMRSSILESRKKSFEESDSSLEKVADIPSSSITSARTSIDAKSDLEIMQDRPLKTKEQLFKKKKNSLEDENSSSMKDLHFIADSEKNTKIRKQKKKKKKERKESKEENEEMEKKEQKEEAKYISITIHRADMLEADYMNIKRPMVKVHIVEADTGAYLRNTENQENGNAFLLPMITGKFDFKENRSMLPVWEEELIFEHSFNAITKPGDGQVLILFEVMDLPSFAEASFSYDRFGSEGCWNRIAWAFLKPVGINSTLHTDKKIRLQLYRPKRNFRKYGKHKCEVYTWWQSGNRDRYPSSLFVTVTSIHPPKLEPVFYQQLALNDLSDTRSDSQGLPASNSISLPKWARLAAQSCKIPNEKMFETEVSENGHFYIAFSNNGKYLACVHTEERNYPIVIYEVETGKIQIQFLGHKTFIYSLNWSSDDYYLLSTSGDQTARIWDVHNKIIEYIEILPHPSYVYCAKYGINNTTIVATGCYDQVVRIWVKNKRSKKLELNQELEGHEGFVNSMVFQKNGNLLTADSVGMIILWAIHRNDKMSSKKEWFILKKIKVKEIEGFVINTIVLHPLESRLLVHTRNNGLRMLDLATGVVLQKYNYLNNQRIQSKACISPCGSLILCGGEDSILNVWNLETGKHIAKYVNERNFRAVTCVDYHPYDHVLAFSTFGSPTPVQILKFNKDASGSDIGLRLTEDISQTHPNEMIMSVLNYPLSSRNKPESNSRKKDPEESLWKGRRVFPSSPFINSEHTLQVRESNSEQTRVKLYHLRKAEGKLKNKSSNRLYHIIQKIDKILSNTSKSSDDLESGKCIESIHERNTSHRALTDKEGEKRQLDETKFFSVNERASSSIESSTSSSAIELNEFVERRRYQTTKKKRPRSAKEIQMKRIIEADQLKTLSDSATRFYDDPVGNTKRNNIESNFITRFKKCEDHSFDFPNSIPFDRVNIPRMTQISSSDSVGTYIVEKTEFEKHGYSSVTAVNDLYNEDIINIKTKQIDFKVFESDSSIPSNATFVIQTETPVPKPRCRKT